MKTVKVIFANPIYNYFTDVNSKVNDFDLKKYFVGTYFNIGCYPTENMQECINIEIFN